MADSDEIMRASCVAFEEINKRKPTPTELAYTATLVEIMQSALERQLSPKQIQECMLIPAALIASIAKDMKAHVDKAMNDKRSQGKKVH